MADNTHIEWTDDTWNPITGCTMVSAGCTNCYAMGLAATRLRDHPSRAGLTRMTGGRAVWTGEVRLNEQWLDQPLRRKRPRMIFVCAHGDLFHENVPDEWIDRVFAVMALSPQHTFQVLTKRPERMRSYLMRRASDWRLHWAESAAAHIPADFQHAGRYQFRSTVNFPLPNVWLGTSIEDQSTADARIPALLATPAAVRFVSAEPLLGSVNLDSVTVGGPQSLYRANALTGDGFDGRRLDWLIVGGESGPGARPIHPDWARALRDQCQAAGMAFFFKQWGEWIPVELPSPIPSEAWSKSFVRQHWPDGAISVRVGKRSAGRLMDGREWNQMPEPARGDA